MALYKHATLSNKRNAYENRSLERRKTDPDRDQAPGIT